MLQRFKSIRFLSSARQHSVHDHRAIQIGFVWYSFYVRTGTVAQSLVHWNEIRALDTNDGSSLLL
jgi:hypothetical protein